MNQNGEGGGTDVTTMSSNQRSSRFNFGFRRGWERRNRQPRPEVNQTLFFEMLHDVQTLTITEAVSDFDKTLHGKQRYSRVINGIFECHKVVENNLRIHDYFEVTAISR